MDYASFKLNLVNIGLDTKLVDGTVVISSGKNQIGEVFLNDTHKFILDTRPLSTDQASRLLNNIRLFSATPTNLRRASE